MGLAGPAWAEPAVVAVFEIEGTGAKVAPKTLSALSELLSASVGAGSRYRVVPQETLKARLATSKAESYKACYDEACQIEIGKELAAEKSLSTKILRIADRCVLTASLFDLRTAVTERTATHETECTDVALMRGVQTLGAELTHDRPAPEPARAVPTVDPNQLTSWRQQEGADFEARDGSLVGSVGRLVYIEPVGDFILELEVERLGGAETSAFGICWRGGGPDGQAPTRAYCAGFQWSGAYNIFVGIGGGWRPITQNWTKNQPYKPTTLIHRQKNHFRLEARGTSYEFKINGQVIDRGTESTHPSGRLYIGTEAGALTKISKIKLTKL